MNICCKQQSFTSLLLNFQNNSSIIFIEPSVDKLTHLTAGTTNAAVSLHNLRDLNNKILIIISLNEKQSHQYLFLLNMINLSELRLCLRLRLSYNYFYVYIIDTQTFYYNCTTSFFDLYFCR